MQWSNTAGHTRVNARRAILGAIAALLIVAAGAYGAAGAGYYVTHDFHALYSGSNLLARGFDPYDEVRWCSETKGLSPEVTNQAGQPLCFVRYAYPLWTAVLLLPLGMMPLELAASLWLALSIAASLAGMRWSWLAVRGQASWAPLFALIVVFSEPFWLLLVLGQMNGVLLAIVGYVAWSSARGHDGRAGSAAAFAALKPNVLPLFGLAFVARALARRSTAFFVGAAATFAGLLAISLAARPTWIGEWLRELFGRQIGYAVEYGTAWGFAAHELGSAAWAPVLIMALVVAVAGLARARLREPVALAAVAVPLSLFATPYAWSYDYLTLALSWAVVLVAAGTAERRVRLALLLALLLVATLLPWLLWIVATARKTEALSAVVPAATALLAATALRYSPPERTVLSDLPRRKDRARDDDGAAVLRHN